MSVNLEDAKNNNLEDANDTKDTKLCNSCRKYVPLNTLRKQSRLVNPTCKPCYNRRYNAPLAKNTKIIDMDIKEFTKYKRDLLKTSSLPKPNPPKYSKHTKE